LQLIAQLTNVNSTSCINQQPAKNRRCVLSTAMERNSWKVFPEGDLPVSESLLIEVYADINTHVQSISNESLTFACANVFRVSVANDTLVSVIESFSANGLSKLKDLCKI